MIYGKTKSQEEDERTIEKVSLLRGIKKFAWRPVVLDDGRKVWLSSYWIRHYGRVAPTKWGECPLRVTDISPEPHITPDKPKVGFAEDELKVLIKYDLWLKCRKMGVTVHYVEGNK